MKKIKSLNLMSWGLDSILAAKVLLEQWIEVIWLCFKTPFFNERNAIKGAEYLWIELIVQEVSSEHLEMVKNPKYWYGKNMNPCIDCHGFMFKKAKKIAEERWIEIIATWEVLWQRPMSQNKSSLKIVEKIADLKDWILRPLSAKFLDETIYEKQWLVNRKKLLDFKWKTRKPQMALAQRYWLTDYPTPAGGCKLTTEQFSDKLTVITRTKEDADLLQTLLKPEYLFIKMKDFPWPHAVVFFFDQNNIEEIIIAVAKKILKYKKVESDSVVFKYEFQNNNKEITITI